MIPQIRLNVNQIHRLFKDYKQFQDEKDMLYAQMNADGYKKLTCVAK